MVFTRDMENLILYLAIIVFPFFCIDVSDWVFSIEYSVALTIAALMLLIRNWISDNKSFTFQATCYFTHLLQAALLSGCAYFLLIGIYYSVTYIFNIFPQSEYNVSSYLSMICFIIGMPCLFLTFNNRQETLSTQEKKICSGNTYKLYTISCDTHIHDHTIHIFYDYFLFVELT